MSIIWVVADNNSQYAISLADVSYVNHDEDAWDSVEEDYNRYTVVMKNGSRIRVIPESTTGSGITTEYGAHYFVRQWKKFLDGDKET